MLYTAAACRRQPREPRSIVMANRWLLLLTALLLMAQTGRTEKNPRVKATPAPKRASAEAEKWVQQTLKKMALDEKLGQLRSEERRVGKECRL